MFVHCNEVVLFLQGLPFVLRTCFGSSIFVLKHAEYARTGHISHYGGPEGDHC